MLLATGVTGDRESGGVATIVEEVDAVLVLEGEEEEDE